MVAIVNIKNYQFKDEHIFFVRSWLESVCGEHVVKIQNPEVITYKGVVIIIIGNQEPCMYIFNELRRR